MATIVTIVEGDGDVQALPILLRMLTDWKHHNVDLPRPKNAHSRSNLIREDGLERFLELARREPRCDGVLVLIDADEDCASQRAWQLAKRAQRLGLPFPIAIVCAKCEYEAWFLASLETIAGHCDVPRGTKYSDPVEERLGVKGWLSRQMPEGIIYKETLHQARMTALLDPDLVRQRSRSFRRLEHALEELLLGQIRVTPVPPPSP